jgi:hypothetical protein
VKGNKNIVSHDKSKPSPGLPENFQGVFKSSKDLDEDEMLSDTEKDSNSDEDDYLVEENKEKVKKKGKKSK